MDNATVRDPAMPRSCEAYDKAESRIEDIAKWHREKALEAARRVPALRIPPEQVVIALAGALALR